MFVNPISNYILIVRSSWSSVISGRLSWAASNKFVGTVECRPHRQSRAAVWPINISHYAAATMMVIKEEKNWSPILDLDMMKHVVSSTWFNLNTAPPYFPRLTIFFQFRETIFLTPFCAPEELCDLFKTISGDIYQVKNKALHHIWSSQEAEQCQEQNCPYFVW